MNTKLAKHLIKHVAQKIDSRDLSCQPFEQTADSFFQNFILNGFLANLVDFKIFSSHRNVCKFSKYAEEVIFFWEGHLVFLVQIVKKKLTPIDQKIAMRIVKAELTVDALASVFNNQFDNLSRRRGIFFPKTNQKLKQIHSVMVHLWVGVFDI